jgi:4-hydroxybenzoate polyprenyltransferase
MSWKTEVVSPARPGSGSAVRPDAPPSAGVLRLLVQSMRPAQWTKNLFVLAPLIFGKKLTDPVALRDALVACLCFCLVSSALYILNDLVDATSDATHPRKRLRPIPSGRLSRRAALGGWAVLSLVSLGLAALLGGLFVKLAAGYYVLIAAYSLVLKRIIILDCMVIAAGFVLRVIGGAAVIEVQASHWLIICAFLLALYLAFAKRRQELLVLNDSASRHRSVLGEYSVPYIEQVNNMLLGATTVCYAIYTVAPETVARFGTDRLIYGTVFVLYGLLRYMFLIQDGEQGGDPSRLLVEDKPLLLSILGWAVYNTLTIYAISSGRP